MKAFCSVDGCNKKAYCKNLCTTHYKRQWRHGDVTQTVRYEGQLCSVEGCSDKARGHGLCQTHRARMSRSGSTERKNRIGHSVNAAGYILLTINGERVYEHTYVAECALGRKLPAGAVVHHMNEIPDDNYTPFNLVICPDQAYHMLLHKRARDLAEAANAHSS